MGDVPEATIGNLRQMLAERDALLAQACRDDTFAMWMGERNENLKLESQLQSANERIEALTAEIGQLRHTMRGQTFVTEP